MNWLIVCVALLILSGCLAWRTNVVKKRNEEKQERIDREREKEYLELSLKAQEQSSRFLSSIYEANAKRERAKQNRAKYQALKRLHRGGL